MDKRKPAFKTKKIFPKIVSMLSMSCKSGTIKSWMYRSNRRRFYAIQLVYETLNSAKKMLFGYKKEGVMRQMEDCRHWTPNKGSWLINLRQMRKRILKLEQP